MPAERRSLTVRDLSTAEAWLLTPLPDALTGFVVRTHSFPIHSDYPSAPFPQVMGCKAATPVSEAPPKDLGNTLIFIYQLLNPRFISPALASELWTSVPLIPFLADISSLSHA